MRLLTWRYRYNKSVKFLCWRWEPLRVWHKPLLLTAGAEAAGLLARLVLHVQGFHAHRHAHTAACTRIRCSWPCLWHLSNVL